MACLDCETAAAKPWHGFADCPGCKARGVSRLKVFTDAMAQGQQTRQYRALLEQAGVTHAEVKAARAKDALRR